MRHRRRPGVDGVRVQALGDDGGCIRIVCVMYIYIYIHIYIYMYMCIYIYI